MTMRTLRKYLVGINDKNRDSKIKDRVAVRVRRSNESKCKETKGKEDEECFESSGVKTHTTTSLKRHRTPLILV